MFGTVASPVPVKKYPSIPLSEVFLLSKFGKCSDSASRNMTDKQNQMITCGRSHLYSLPRDVFAVQVSWLYLL